MMTGQIQISSFIKAFSQKLNLNDKALFQLSSDFKCVDTEHVHFENTLTEINKDDRSKYDLVFAELPFGWAREPFVYDEQKKVNGNWNMLSKTLQTLDLNGTLFAAIEPYVYWTVSGQKFLEILGRKGYNCNLILNAPSKLYAPMTLVTPIILGFQRKKSDDLFIAEIQGDNTDLIISNFQEKNSDSIQNGKWVERKSFETFEKAIIEGELNALQTQYNDYQYYRLSDVAISINLTQSNFAAISNSIYLSKIGATNVVSSINSINTKHQNVFQIQLNPDLVIADYLVSFYESKVGQLILASLKRGSTITSIRKNELKESQLSIPSIKDQKLIIETNNKLGQLQATVNELKSELSINPHSAHDILKKFDSIAGPLIRLSTEDEILATIRKGENKKIEFKQTFSKNMHTGQKDKEIEKSSLKNIVGFLNSDGGILLIGVSDSGEVTGVGDDFYQSKDRYLLNFKNALSSKIGSEFYSLINYDVFEILGKKILRVVCKPCKKACFYDVREFYVRTNPATDRLEGQKLIDYVDERFND